LLFFLQFFVIFSFSAPFSQVKKSCLSLFFCNQYSVFYAFCALKQSKKVVENFLVVKRLSKFLFIGHVPAKKQKTIALF
jgi:hypothetical protein